MLAAIRLYEAHTPQPIPPLDDDDDDDDKSKPGSGGGNIDPDDDDGADDEDDDEDEDDTLWTTCSRHPSREPCVWHVAASSKLPT